MASIFSNPCKYALQALVHLARHAKEGPLLLRNIAEAEGIPASFLAKVLQNLAREGLLSSAKGPGGGFALARDASEIRLRQVVEAVDGLHAIEWCCMRIGPCDMDDPCPLHKAWPHVQDQIAFLLEETTLQDLADGGAKAEVIRRITFPR